MALKTSADGHSVEFPADAKIEVVGAVKEPTLASDQFDPFARFKTDPDKYYYRALNIRPQNMRVRQSEGFETIPDSEYGDLVLARLPKEEHEKRLAKEDQKTVNRTRAAVDTFKQTAAAAGVKTFEE